MFTHFHDANLSTIITMFYLSHTTLYIIGEKLGFVS